ncbi:MULTISPECIES: DUF6049 family protein [Pseudonocardia]|uniref:Glycoprotein n=2 Tax=Pseudonocardia TaxID=1847 RepID=A0A1Y2MPV0_PSEAH|nr:MULTISPECIES: DUF6049 family protein [Pseudonocardia]OSY37212.1 hypothetical protein BG845_04906 [Pseudonocardia autotrophica]TDN74833.1 hypothetical protein C8E95_3963 [Pseudonocardia autotrophica]BBG05608.1 glycoprotein [Pseudonocardia autotrophica]GEC25859.1 glycoprotein [Pseudonocardia saturnea]
MSRVAALVAILLAALLTGSVAAPGPALAQEQPDVDPVRLEVDTMSPRVVTSAGPPELVVTGSVTNTGRDRVDDLSLRVQRGPAVDGEPALRSAFAGDAPVDDATPPFAQLGPLAPGGSVPFRYSVPLTGDRAASLALPGPGTYPLLVNLNGTVNGTPSRIAGIRTALPVSSLPGTPPDPSGAATPVSMLYPITDAPRRIPPVPGQVPVLTDDDLATSMAPGGRLHGLVDALATGAPAGSPVRTALCLAIDPELVATAAAMSGGYEVTVVPGGETAPGRGAAAAGEWLEALRGAAAGSCVLALPPSDADLVALVRAGQAELARATLEQGRAALSEQLNTAVLDDMVWPADGVLDEPTLEAFGGGTRFLLSADGVSSGQTSGVVRLRDGPGGGDRAVLADPLLAQAATGPAVVELQDGGAGGLSGQELAGALAFRAAQGETGGSLLVTPPRGWAAGREAAAGIISALAALIQDGRLAAAGLPGLAAQADPATEATGLFYPVQAGGAEIPGQVIDTVADQVRSIEGLRGAAEARTGVGASPAEVFDPLVRGTLRAASSWWRADPARAEREAAIVAGRIEQIRASVRVVQPPSPYSLGTSDAPLLITVANGLPVTMNVRVVLSSTTGLRVAPIPVQAVPPLGRVQVRVSAQVTRSGQFGVDAGLRTPDGAELGPDTRLRVRSTVYGTVTVWLTGIAGALLVVLVVRRIVRRVRAGSGPADPSGDGTGAGPGAPGPEPSRASDDAGAPPAPDSMPPR